MSDTQADSTPMTKGQRLGCEQCGSEIEVVNPCTCEPPDQEFVCCGKAMVPTTSGSVNLNVG